MSNAVEGIAELTHARLKTSTTPGVVLAQFYGQLIGVEIGRSEIISCNKLVKIFGKYSLFFSILDIAKKGEYTEFPYGLLYKICKDRLENIMEAEITASSHVSLDRMLNGLREEMSKVKKIDPEKASKILDEGTV